MTETTIPIDEADYAFIAAAARQLHPTQRPVFATRVHALLQNILEPGPGDVDRAVRMALRGIWDPPELEKQRDIEKMHRGKPPK
jgi:hypothetical protein